MIVYFASYPRSGNAWVRSLILNQFARLSSDIYASKGPFDEENLRRLKITLPEKHDLFGLHKSDPLYCRRFSYIPNDGANTTHKAFVPGIKDLFAKSENRKRLAGEEEKYFVKTHFDPYPLYHPGEFVIQIVRNPGACIWSYYNFLKDVLNVPTPLNDIITGHVEYGAWVGYQQKWIDTAAVLKENLLQVRYEDLFGKELEFCQRLSVFIGLKIVSTDIKPFEFYHAKRPSHAREGKPSGWEGNYSREQLEMLWNIHGAVMRQYGYPEPDYQAGLVTAIN